MNISNKKKAKFNQNLIFIVIVGHTANLLLLHKNMIIKVKIILSFVQRMSAEIGCDFKHKIKSYFNPYPAE